ncbi:hypothetical protein Ancab_015509 [Ancistrocladus abbreviatus]
MMATLLGYHINYRYIRQLSDRAHFYPTPARPSPNYSGKEPDPQIKLMPKLQTLDGYVGSGR